jgi:hypothetical protein
LKGRSATPLFKGRSISERVTTDQIASRACEHIDKRSARRCRRLALDGAG